MITSLMEHRFVALPHSFVPIYEYPITDPRTGELLDNLETVPERVLNLFRERGMDDEALRTHAFKIDVPDEEVEEAFKRARAIITSTHRQLQAFRTVPDADQGH